MIENSVSTKGSVSGADATAVDLQSKLVGLKRGAVHLVSEDELVSKLQKSESSGTQLRIKLGADPSSADLHIGHAVVLRKMRQFQDLGHKVILIIGDFTAMIGDPTGRSKTRPALALEETRRNGATYVAQVKKILDSNPAKLEIRYNSEWLEQMSFKDVIRLAQTYTVARMLERDDFANRFKNEIPIGIHEFLYPLSQAFDSVAIKADVELGGTDQLFNNLVGRYVQREFQQEPQVVLTTPLLTGLDGKEKMSKSLGNYIGIAETPASMFKKSMQVPDGLLFHYFELCTSFNLDEARDLIARDIVEAHRVFGRELIQIYHGSEAIVEAEARYNEVAGGDIPVDVREFVVPAAELQSGSVPICRLATLAGISVSNSEARRLILNRGIKVNGETVTDPAFAVHPIDKGIVIQRGKDSFVRILFP